MGREWPIVRLGDVVELLTGFPFKSQNYTQAPSDPRLLRGDNVGQGRLRWDGVQRWPLAQIDGLDSYWLREGDVILAMDRPWIEAGLKYACVEADDMPCLLVQRVSRLRGRAGLTTAFLRYVIGSRQFTEHVLAVQTGTSVPHISPAQIREFAFALPSADEQLAIVSILGALDDRIELNRRTSETLDAMARALFKSWFVDFDPVRANAGRLLDSAVVSMFPSALRDSPVGAVPGGWRVCSLGEVMELKRGYDLPTSSRLPGNVPVVSSSGPTSFHNEARAKGPGIVTGRYGTIGRVFLVWDDYWPLNTALYVKELRDLEVLYAYYLLQEIDFHKFSDKAAVPGINRNHVEMETVCVAPVALQVHFARLVEPMLTLARHRQRESETLVQVRDLLVPRLLAGKLHVRDVQRSLEAVA